MKIPRTYNKICVLGGGLWGTALAHHLAQNGASIWLWEFFPELARRLEASRRHPHIPGFKLNRTVRVGSDLGAAARGAKEIFVVMPSTVVRATARNLRPLLSGTGRKPILINASKGVEPGSLKTMGRVLEEELPFLRGRVATLSGPSFAKEVALGVPTKMVLGGPPAVTREAAKTLNGGNIRVELSRDRTGVELGGSLKNVLAIGCGLLDGLKAGANTKAALMTAGLRELAALTANLGGRRETIYGLAGLGDMIATGTSEQSRNRALGEKLADGRGLKAALKEIPTVAEGVESARSVRELIKARGLKAPVLQAIGRIVHAGAPPRSLVKALGF